LRFLPLVFKNVLRKKTRTLLTMGSIVLPLLVICLMGTFLRALDRPDPAATRGMFRIVTRHKVGLGSLIPVTYAEKIRQLDGARAVTKFVWFGGRYRDQSSKNFFPRFAVEPETFLQVFDDAKIVRGSAEEWLSDRAGCVVGANLVKRYGWAVGDKIVLVGDIYPIKVELTVRGVFDVPDGTASALFFHRKYLEEALPAFAGTTGTIWTKCRDAASATALIDVIDRLFENSSYPTKTESEKAFQMGFVSMLGNVKLLLTAIGAVIVGVVVLIAANTMAMTARERVTEIAVLRTLGFQRSTILGMVLGESLVIALLAGGLGLALFAAVEPGLQRGLLSTPMGAFAASMRLFPEVLAVGFAVAVGVGLVAGVVPAARSAQRSIVDGLRQIA